ncbi:MAG: alpha/beta hydrolase [Alphaproteobacteria bacterium]
MPELIIAGPGGRLEARYQHAETPQGAIALILHPHPLYGGSMNNRVVYDLFYAFHRRNFSVMRFNFRGVGRSQGEFDSGIGELSDAAAALDWLQTYNPNARKCWIAGFSFGAWIAMQLLMRRPEITGFISVAPPANMFDFSFLAPCPASGLIINGTDDQVVPPADVEKLAERLKAQKGITIDHQTVPGANHFFEKNLDTLIGSVEDYVDRRLEDMAAAAPAPE